MLEQYALIAIVLGILLVLIGMFWLLVRAFRQGKGWGFAVLFLPPTALLFSARHYVQAAGPFRVILLGGLLGAIPYAVNFIEQQFIPLKPYEQMVDGGLRITLTGVKDFHYAILRQKPKLVVLQMANPEVDDQTLENLKGMDHLVELDLNGTQITDRGLATIAALPRLKNLRLARTKITDEGFRAHLLPKESLVHLDLTGTEVKGKTKREWKNQKPEEREYVD